MRATALSILGGVLLLVWLPELPPGLWVALAVAVSLWLAFRVRICRWLALSVLGFAWAWLFGAWGMAHTLAPALEGQDIALVGRIASIPESHGDALRFLVAVDSLAGNAAGQPRRVRLSWYDTRQTLRPGERWRFVVRLKRPHGFMNPGGFDYEGWLFQHGIDATGYVRHNQAVRLAAAGWHDPVLRLRVRLARGIRRAVPHSPFAGILVALAVGERSGITDAQWHVFRRTGTSHLDAISGLHIGLVAGLVFLLIRALWGRIPTLGERLPAAIAASLLALLAAAGYAALAGFGLPTRRALVMLTAVTGALCLRRHNRPADVLALALLAVLVLDPLSVLSPGFWLSFGAVASILFGIIGRRRPSRYRGWLWVQWVVSLGLLPLTVLFFQRGSLIAPLANLVAIPVFSFAVVPLALLGAVLYPCVPLLGALLLKGAALVLAGLWPLLERLSDLQF